MSRLLVGIIAAVLPLAVVAAPESYTMDPYHTFPNFEVNHFGFANIRGRFDKTAGKFTIDRAAKTGSLEITVQTASANTGDHERGDRPRTRDEHLRTADFFNSIEFPTMTFRSTGVTFNGDKPAVVAGNLIMLGVSRPVPLQVQTWRCGPHQESKKEMCGGTATASFKRSEFGMKYGIPLFGDEIKLWIGFEAYKN
jgi:polyisoprenoid-binding protein YceI